MTLCNSILCLTFCLSLSFVKHQSYNTYRDEFELHIIFSRGPQSIVIDHASLLAYLIFGFTQPPVFLFCLFLGQEIFAYLITTPDFLR